MNNSKENLRNDVKFLNSSRMGKKLHVFTLLISRRTLLTLQTYIINFAEDTF